MQLIHITAESRQEFNDFIRGLPWGDLLQSWEWGDLKAETGWEPFRLAVREKGQIVAAASALKRNLPLAGKTILYLPRGPMLTDLNRVDLLDTLLTGLRGLARRVGAILLKIDPPIPASHRDFHAALMRRGFINLDLGKGFEGVQPRFIMELPIDQDPEELLMQCESKTRYNIRLAQRRGVTVHEARDLEDLRAFYELLLVTAKRDGFMVRDFSYFEGIWRHLVQKGLARLFLARYEGGALAGAITFQFGKRTWYVYGASSNRHRNVMPNHILQWNMILAARESGSTVYDFRGISGDLNPDNPLYGLYRFKKGFGARVVEYLGEYDLPLNRFFYVLWRRGLPLLRRVRARLGSGGRDENNIEADQE